MAGSSFIFNSKRIPTAFMASVVLFVLTQAVIVNAPGFWKFCYFFSYPSSGDKLRMEAQLRLMPADSTVKKVFLIGSSEVREDYDTALLNKVFMGKGVHFYNFGLSGYGSPLEMLYVKNEIAAYKPDVVVYMPYIGSFYPDGDFDVINTLRSYFHPSMIPYLQRHLGSAVVFNKEMAVIYLDYLWSQMSPLYKYRDQMQLILTASARNTLGVEKRSEPLRFAYKANQHPTYFVAEILKEKSAKFRKSALTGLNQELFTDLVDEFAEKGAGFMAVSGPPNPLIKETFAKELNDEYQIFLTAQAQKRGFVFVPEDQLPVFDIKEFIDFTHLNAVGRTHFTLYFAEVFAAVFKN